MPVSGLRRQLPTRDCSVLPMCHSGAACAGAATRAAATSPIQAPNLPFISTPSRAPPALSYQDAPGGSKRDPAEGQPQYFEKWGNNARGGRAAYDDDDA